MSATGGLLRLDTWTPPGGTVVHLMRHGEVHNPDHVLYGRLPGFGLSVAGRQMAVVTGEALAARPLTGLYVSPLQRARETIAPLESATGLTAVIEPRVIESDSVFEGQRLGVGDGALRDPRNWRYLWDPFTPSWGEPYVEVAARMSAAIAQARGEQRGGEAVIVSHQLPVVCGRRAAEGRVLWHRPDRRQCGLASVTSLVFDVDDHLVRTVYSEPAARVPTGDETVAAGA